MSIEITPALLAEWRQKAEAAGGKQWEVYESSDGIFIVDANDGEGPHLAEVWWPKEANHIAAANPAVVLALVAEIAKLKAESIEKDIQRAEGVLRMFRGEQQDFLGIFSERDLIAEGLDKPADADGTTAGIWASFIERKQLEAEQYRSLAK
jgi:hypothetical protein